MTPKRAQLQDRSSIARKFIITTTQKCLPGWLQGLQLDLPVPEGLRSVLANNNVVLYPSQEELGLLRVLQMVRGNLEDDIIASLGKFGDCTANVFELEKKIQKLVKKEDELLREMSQRWQNIYSKRMQMKTILENAKSTLELAVSHMDLLSETSWCLPRDNTIQQHDYILSVFSILGDINVELKTFAEYKFEGFVKDLETVYAECIRTDTETEISTLITCLKKLLCDHHFSTISGAFDNHLTSWADTKSTVSAFVNKNWPSDFCEEVTFQINTFRKNLASDVTMWKTVISDVTRAFTTCVRYLEDTEDASEDFYFGKSFAEISDEISKRLKITREVHDAVENQANTSQKDTERKIRDVVEKKLMKLAFVVNDKCLKEELDSVINAWRTDNASILIIHAISPLKIDLKQLAVHVSDKKKIIFYGPNVPEWTYSNAYTCSESQVTFREFDAHSQDYILGLPIHIYKMRFQFREFISKTDNDLLITNDALKEMIVRSELNSEPVLQWLEELFLKDLSKYKSIFMSDSRSPCILFHAYVLARHSPLHQAVLLGKTDEVDRLIDLGHGIDALDLAGRTPLHLASLCTDDDRKFIVAKIANNRPNINVRDKVCNFTALEYFDVCIGRYDDEYDWKCIEMLVAEEEVSISSAAFYNLPCTLKRLLDNQKKSKNDANFINKLDSEGNTVGHVAIYGGSDSCFKIVLENGLDVNIPNVNGDSVLYSAAECGTVAAVDLLLKLQPKIDLSVGKSPLHVAVRNNYRDIVPMLLDFGADVNELRCCDSFKDMVLAMVGRPLHGCYPPESARSSAGITPLDESKPQCGYSARPLHVACFRGHEKMTRLLLDRGAQVDAADSNGNTALHVAALGDRVSSAQLLLSSGASLSVRNKNGEFPIDVARRKKNSVLGLILRHCPNKMFPSFC